MIQSCPRLAIILIRCGILWLSGVSALDGCLAQPLACPRPVIFDGHTLHESSDLSAVGRIGNFLIVGSDEGHVIQILEDRGHDTFRLIHKYSLPDGSETDRVEAEEPEIDIEGIATKGNQVYIVGSHSRTRSKVKPGNPKRRSRWENRHRLTENELECSRRALLRLTLGNDGQIVGDIQTADLWAAVNKFDVLKPFTTIPSKENGIDIEGITAQGDWLYVGFRGPVLRENWVPILVTQFEDIVAKAKLRYVNLGGLGIRDMVAVNDRRILLIAGPVGDGPGGYHLYCWDGLDCVPGKNGAPGSVEYLGAIPTTDGAKAEGLTLLDGGDDDGLRVLIVFDGPAGGAPVAFTLSE